MSNPNGLLSQNIKIYDNVLPRAAQLMTYEGRTLNGIPRSQQTKFSMS